MFPKPDLQMREECAVHGPVEVYREIVVLVFIPQVVVPFNRDTVNDWFGNWVKFKALCHCKLTKLSDCYAIRRPLLKPSRLSRITGLKVFEEDYLFNWEKLFHYLIKLEYLVTTLA